MYKRALLAALLVLAPSLAWAACPGTTRDTTGYQRFTVSTTATSLTIPAGTDLGIATVETGAIYFADDGTTVTATNGSYAPSVSAIEICGPQLGRFQMIRSTADSVVTVRYYGLGR